MTALLKRTEPWTMTADQAAQRTFGRAARSELALRNWMEGFARRRWPDARICHEMMMGERSVRADMVVIGKDHIVAVEVKGRYDNLTRIIYQLAMYKLCMPEVWTIVDGRHADVVDLIAYLLPDIGAIVGRPADGAHQFDDWDQLRFDVEREAMSRPPVPEMALDMLWASELRAACDDTRTVVAKRATRPQMIKHLLDLPWPTLQRTICTQLRARDALWRADAPIRSDQS